MAHWELNATETIETHGAGTPGPFPATNAGYEDQLTDRCIREVLRFEVQC